MITKPFFSASLGTLIEYYDYSLFSLFLPILAPLFFPADTIYQSLVKGYFIVLLTVFFRPLGGLIFGYVGDLYGRRHALLTSMYGIAFATFLLGILPTYETIGSIAILLLGFAKAIQIFCFGGEYNGAGIYVVEHAQHQNEGLVGSLLNAVTLFGSLFASLIGVILTAHGMPSWSWRLAFILGGLIGIAGIIYRKNLIESPQFEKTNSQSHGWLKLLKDHPNELLASIFMGAFATVPFTTVFIFINPVLMSQGYFNNHELMWIQTFLCVISIITLIPTGLWADKKSPKKVLQISALCLLFFSFPLLYIIDQKNVLGLLFAMTGLIILNEMFLGPSPAYLKNLFKMQYRYRGSSFGFCLGMSLFGGLTPVVENYLYQWTGNFSAIAIWLSCISMLTFLTVSLAKPNLSKDRAN